jgi:hypothetical protein
MPQQRAVRDAELRISAGADLLSADCKDIAGRQIDMRRDRDLRLNARV